MNSLVGLVKEPGLVPLKHFEKPVSICAFLMLTTQHGENGFEVDEKRRPHSWPGVAGISWW